MPGPLINANDLHARLGDERVLVADVHWYLGRPGTGREAYGRGHIPGAVFVDLDTDLSDEHGFGAPGRHPLPSPAEFARRMGVLGFASDDFIVACDDAGGTIAARLWWMLDDLGHRGGCAVLDGGIKAWTAAGYDLTTDTGPRAAAEMHLADEWRNVIAREQVADGRSEHVLLDARAPERYRGEVEPIDPAAGHIPGARNVPTSANLSPDGLLLDAASLEALYAPLTAVRKNVVVSCGSGTTACHSALAIRLAGLRDPLLYVGSFSDWSRSGMPVVSGDQP